MLGLALTALLLAAPQVDSITVVLPSPASALPRLQPLLNLAGSIAPRLSPNRIKARLGPLGLDPFTASPAQWRLAGLNPEADATIIATRRSLRVRLSIEDSAALRHHLKAQPKLRTSETPGFGLLSGRPGRPNLLGVEVKKHFWLASHRVVMPVSKKDRTKYATAKIGALAQAVRPWRTPTFERLRSSKAPKRSADAKFKGRGPSPVSSYTGAVWVQPERFVGSLRLRLDDIATLIAQSWVPKTAPAKLLQAPNPVVEVITSARPSALIEAIEVLPSEAKPLLRGSVHAVLTAEGSLVIALGLRCAGDSRKLRNLTDTFSEHPGLKWAHHGKPSRLVLWYPGRDRDSVQVWTQRPIGGRAPAPTTVTTQPHRLLSALGHRDAQTTGPRLGLGRRTILRLTFGALLGGFHRFETQIRKAHSGFDLRLQASFVGPSR